MAVFEDNYLLRDGYYHLINGTAGFACAGVFDSANDIIFKISSTRPDVILMDIDMPGINGIEATTIIKEQFPNIYIMWGGSNW